MAEKGLKETMSRMTFQEKLEYLWTYYKWVLGIAAGVVLILCIIATGISNSRTELLYKGILVNVDVTDAGNACLTEQLYTQLDGHTKRQKVDLTKVFVEDFETAADPEGNMASALHLVTLVSIRELDYALMDQFALDYYKTDAVFSSLEDVLPPELLTELSDLIIYYDDPDSGRYPVAIDLTDSAFAQECVQTRDKVYISFPGNTGRNDRNTVFLEYLLSWNP